MLAYLVSLALLAWGAINPPTITIEFFPNEINGGVYAQTGYHPETASCLIGVSSSHWPGLSPSAQESLIAHEVGHCLGLPDYGDCNSTYTASIMGCAMGLLVQPLDRLRYLQSRQLAYKTFAVGVAAP